MKLARFLPLAAACAALLASCSDDPFTPGGSYTAPEYHATLQSLDTQFTSVCGAGDRDIYAFGGTLLHYDGSQWQPAPPPPVDYYRSIAVGFESGALAMCTHREVYVLQDGTWRRLEEIPEYANDFWGTSPDDLYALAYPGVYHYQGTSWELIPVPKAGELIAIADDGTGHPIMCGQWGRVDRFNGVDWTATYGDSTTWYRSVAVTPSGRTYVAYDAMGGDIIGELIDSTATPLLQGEISNALLRVDGEILYAAGHDPENWSNFRIAEYRNSQWRPVYQGPGRIEDFWAGNGELACVGDDNFLWQGTAAGGARVNVAPSRGPLYDAVAIGDAIYAIGNGAYRYQNGAWEDLDKEYITRNTAYGIDGRRPDDIYAVGPEMILHYDGASWQWVNAGFGRWLKAVWVDPRGHVVAVGDGPGDGPSIIEFDGETWTERIVPFDGYRFNDVIGFNDTIFTVGGWGLVAIRKQGHWYVMRPTNSTFTAVWGSDEQHVYAVGARDNEIWFYNGDRWNPIEIQGPELQSMVSIWGTTPSNMFVLDDNGTLAHFNGRSWNAEERIFSSRMYAITGNSRELLTVSEYGSALYRR